MIYYFHELFLTVAIFVNIFQENPMTNLIKKKKNSFFLTLEFANLPCRFYGE